MATGKDVIQGYTGAAAVDASHQIIVAPEAHGSGSEQSLLVPMIEHAKPFATDRTLITADAGYHSEANLKQLSEQGSPALIADGLTRKRDERFKDQGKHKLGPDPLYNKARAPKSAGSGKLKPQDFSYDVHTNTCICPAGKTLYSNGSQCTTKGRTHHKIPLHCDLAGFDFTQSKVDRSLITELADLSFTEAAHNVVVKGNNNYGRVPTPENALHLSTGQPMTGSQKPLVKIQRAQLVNFKRAPTIRRLVQLLKREVQAAIAQNSHDRRGASAVA